MKKLEERIRKEGVAVGSDRINVDGFINHKVDTYFLDEIGEEFARLFSGVKVDKILTVEASGIGIAVTAARYFGFCPVVFAKKSKPNTMLDDCYTENCFSFTKQENNIIRVGMKHLSEGENILVIDDFLAHGEASIALCNIIEKAGAKVAGVGIVISKDFQGGKKALQDRGYKVECLASVKSLENGQIEFY